MSNAAQTSIERRRSAGNDAQQKEGPLHRPANRETSSPPVVSFSAAAVYETVRVEGLHEMDRPLPSLWWSGVAAGFAMIFSVLVPAFLLERGASSLMAPLGYTVGFIIVVMGRLQLFTENTITTVLPLLSQPSWRSLWLTGRLWFVVFLANFVGGGLAVAMTLWAGLLDTEQLSLLTTLSRHAVEGTAYANFMRAMPAGFLIAAVVWLTRTTENQQLLIIAALTYVMSIGGFAHVVAGSIEACFLVLHTDYAWGHALFGFVAPALFGNIVGGTGLFALLSYGQVRLELDEQGSAGHGNAGRRIRARP